MRRISTCYLVLTLVGAPVSLSAQNETVAQAQRTFQDFDFPQALALARSALHDDLDEADLVNAYEVIGYSLGALDSADAAVQMLSEMIVLDPEHEPDVQALPPRLVNLYAQALSQVLVVRHILVDSTDFVGGFGRVTMHYEVSRPSFATISLVGNGIETTIDSQLVDPGDRRFDWDALVDGSPVPAGDYRVLVHAEEGRNTYEAFADISVVHGGVDTLEHVDRIEGFDFVPESRVPPRDWRPLGVASLVTGVATGAALALGDGALAGSHREMIGVSVSALATGLMLSLRAPEPQPVPEAIQLNALIRQEIAERNRRIAEDNEAIRRRVRLTIVQVMDR